MARKRAITGFILALGLASCQGNTFPSQPSSEITQVATRQQIIKTGSFAGAERPTSGIIQITQANNTFQIEFSGDFKTANGPDLQVVLHRSSDLLSELSPPKFPLQSSDYVILSRLKSSKGPQTYSIPSDINIEDYGSVAIWCQKFNATFGSANLKGS